MILSGTEWVLVSFRRVEAMRTTQRYIGKTVLVQIDRPLGSRHPRHDFIYSVNYGYYGYIPDTVSVAGREYSDAQIHALIEFQERLFEPIILR